MKRSRVATAVALGLTSALFTGTALAQSSAAQHKPAAHKPLTQSHSGSKAKASSAGQQVKKPAAAKNAPVCRDDTNPARNKEIRQRIKKGGGEVYQSKPGKTRFDALGSDGVKIVDSVLKQGKRQGKTPVISGGAECGGHSKSSVHKPTVPGDAIDVILKGAKPKENRKLINGVKQDLIKQGISADRIKAIYNGGKPVCSPENQKGKSKAKDKDHCRHGHIQITPAPKAKPKSTSGAGETTFVAPKKSKSPSK